MTELEARKIFDVKLALCGTLGLDVREVCVNAGLPVEMVDRFIAADRALTNAMRICTNDPAVLPTADSTPRDAARQGFSCLSQRVTGLPMIIWIMSNGARAGVPYIRVQADHSSAPRVTGSVCLSIDENPDLVGGSGLAAEDKAAAAAFVRLNRDALLEHWNGVKEPSALIGMLKS